MNDQRIEHLQRIGHYRRAIQAIVDYELHRRAVADASSPSGWPIWAVVIAVLGALAIVGALQGARMMSSNP